MQNKLDRKEFQGRIGLSRTLKCRTFGKTGLIVFMLLSLCFAVFFSIDVLAQVLTGHLKPLFSARAFFQLFGLMTSASMTWIVFKTQSIRIHLNGKQLIYEIKDQSSVEISYDDIRCIRFQRENLVSGFFLDLKSGVSYHFPINIERLDYVLDTLYSQRPDLGFGESFMSFRAKALAIDHILAHNNSYFTRGHFEIIFFYFAYPFFIAHDLKRVKADPYQVRRDIAYEKKLQNIWHKVNIAISFTALIILVLLNRQK